MLWLTPHRRKAQGFTSIPFPSGVLLCSCVLLGWAVAEGICSSVVEVKYKIDLLLLLLGLRVQLVVSFKAKISQT